MGVYSSSIVSLKRDLKERSRLTELLSTKRQTVEDKSKEYDTLVEASKLISAVADKQAMETLDCSY